MEQDIQGLDPNGRVGGVVWSEQAAHWSLIHGQISPAQGPVMLQEVVTVAKAGAKVGQ